MKQNKVFDKGSVKWGSWGIIVSLFFIYVESSCWGAGIYRVSAIALASGVGSIDSSAVCVYGYSATLDDDCPLTCQSLLMATWGDCYCRNPDYKPKAFGANILVKPMSVKELYTFLAEKGHPSAPYATCRNWLIENKENWSCDPELAQDY